MQSEERKREKEKKLRCIRLHFVITSFPQYVSLVFKRRTRFMWISNWRNYNAPEKSTPVPSEAEEAEK